MDLYAENILEHYKEPRNKGELENPSIKVHEVNPLCGDEIYLELKVESEKIKDVKFHGQGCAISQASASMVTEEIKGKTLTQAKELTKEDVFKLVGVPLSPSRVKCALLCLGALKMAIEEIERGK